MSESNPLKVEIYTDGSCLGNPGPGGWAFIVRGEDGAEQAIAGGDVDTTNNRMELMAAIRALKMLRAPATVTLYTDSQYVMKGLTEWLPNWVRKGWRTAAGKPVKNADLWKALVAAAEPHTVEWVWVRGHAGHPDNERADQLANAAAHEVAAEEA